MRKIDTEEFAFSPSARNGAVTEGDADCWQVLSVCTLGRLCFKFHPKDDVIAECERGVETDWDWNKGT